MFVWSPWNQCNSNTLRSGQQTKRLAPPTLCWHVLLVIDTRSGDGWGRFCNCLRHLHWQRCFALSVSLKFFEWKGQYTAACLLRYNNYWGETGLPLHFGWTRAWIHHQIHLVTFQVWFQLLPQYCVPLLPPTDMPLSKVCASCSQLGPKMATM